MYSFFIYLQGGDHFLVIFQSLQKEDASPHLRNYSNGKQKP